MRRYSTRIKPSSLKYVTHLWRIFCLFRFSDQFPVLNQLNNHNQTFFLFVNGTNTSLKSLSLKYVTHLLTMQLRRTASYRVSYAVDVDTHCVRNAISSSKKAIRSVARKNTEMAHVDRRRQSPSSLTMVHSNYCLKIKSSEAIASFCRIYLNRLYLKATGCDVEELEKENNSPRTGFVVHRKSDCRTPGGISGTYLYQQRYRPFLVHQSASWRTGREINIRPYTQCIGYHLVQCFTVISVNETVASGMTDRQELWRHFLFAAYVVIVDAAACCQPRRRLCCRMYHYYAKSLVQIYVGSDTNDVT